MWQCTHNFSSTTHLCNVVPLLELTVKNSKHPNFHLSRGGRVAVCFVLQSTPFNDIVYTVLPPIFLWRIVNPLFTPYPPSPLLLKWDTSPSQGSAGWGLSCHSLVEGAPSIYSLDHWQCYQKARYIERKNAPKWVITPPLLLSCTMLRLVLILLFSRAVPALSLCTGGDHWRRQVLHKQISHTMRRTLARSCFGTPALFNWVRK